MTTPQSSFEKRERDRRRWVAWGAVAGLALFFGLAVVLGNVVDLHGHQDWLGAGAVVAVALVGILFVGLNWRPWRKQP